MPHARSTLYLAILTLGLAACPDEETDSVDTDAGDTDPAVFEACGDDLVDGRDGQAYRTVEVAGSCWTRDNMNLGTLIDSTKTGYQMSNNGEVEKYCWDNDEVNCDDRGGFYEWKEATQLYTGSPSGDVQGICPDGWHLPSQAEFLAMVDEFGGVSRAAGALQVGGESGLDMSMTGYRCTMTGGFRPSAMSDETMTYFWVSDSTDHENAPLWEIGPTSITNFSYSKSLGLSVRCILD